MRVCWVKVVNKLGGEIGDKILKGVEMTKWLVYFKGQEELPYFRLFASEDLHTAEMMAKELAKGDNVKFLGVIVAPQSCQ